MQWGSNFVWKPNLVNPKHQHHQPYDLPPKVSGKLVKLNLLITFLFDKKILVSSILCRMQISPCGIKLNTLEVYMWKKLNITYTAVVWINFRTYVINNDISNLWEFRRIRHFYLIGLLRWTNHDIQLARPTFTKNYIFGMVSTLWWLMCSTLF